MDSVTRFLHYKWRHSRLLALQCVADSAFETVFTPEQRGSFLLFALSSQMLLPFLVYRRDGLASSYR